MVSLWLENAGRHPLLTPAQEVTLGNQVRAWLDADNPDSRTIKRGQRARQKFIQCNLRLVTAVAKKYTTRIKSNSTVSLEDLLQEGSLGLARAVEKFDPATGYKFSTYAYWWIRQSMGRLCDMNVTAIRVTPLVVHLALKWRYRPEGQTLEEFAAERNRDPEWIQSQLALWQRAQVKSLDVKSQDDDERSTSKIDLIASDLPDDDGEDYAQILDDLKYLDGGVLKESLAVLELAEEAKPTEVAELMGWSPAQVKRKLQDCRSQIREHLPSHIRQAIVGPEKNLSGKLEVPQPAPVRELVAVGCNAAQSSPMQSTNGHQSLEQEAVAVIAEVQAEAPKPKRRSRRTAAEMQAEKESALISVVIDGTQFAGQPDHIARLLVAMKAA
jgi:RNA polymerase sigma factor (sigma-70 family)